MSKLHYFNLIRSVWHYARENRPRIVLFYSMFIVANIALLFQPYLLGKTITLVQAGGDNLFERAIPLLAGYAGVMGLFWLLHGPARILENDLGLLIRTRFYQDMYRKVTELPLKWHQDNHSGTTINRINKAASGLYLFSQSQFVYIEIGVRSIGPIIMMAILVPKVALFTLCAGTIIFLTLSRFDRLLVRFLREENEKEHKVSSAFFDYVSNINTIITLRLADRTHQEISRRLYAVFPTMHKFHKLNEVKWSLLFIMIALTEVGIMLYLIYSFTHSAGTIAIGILVMVFQYLRQINQSFISFAVFYKSLITYDTNLKTIDPILAAHAENERIHPHLESYDWQQIDIKGLNFTYDNNDPVRHKRHNLHNVAITLKKGQRIAFVGESGAGKSTLLSVLRGIYETPPVEINIDGRHYNDMAILSPLATLVPQDPEIFENTILYNVTVGVESDAAAIEDAAYTAFFEGVARDLPLQYETDIREKGVNLSGGQKQRLALARGMFSARETSLLLLDEPTSSVDPATESEIYNRIFAAHPDSCIISTIHRLHLLGRFDWIYVIDKGQIAEQGTFSALIAKDGILKRLWAKQEQTSQQQTSQPESTN